MQHNLTPTTNPTLEELRGVIAKSPYYQKGLTTEILESCGEDLERLLQSRANLNRKLNQARGFFILRNSSDERYLTSEKTAFPFTITMIESNSVLTADDVADSKDDDNIFTHMRLFLEKVTEIGKPITYRVKIQKEHRIPEAIRDFMPESFSCLNDLFHQIEEFGYIGLRLKSDSADIPLEQRAFSDSDKWVGVAMYQKLDQGSADEEAENRRTMQFAKLPVGPDGNAHPAHRIMYFNGLTGTCSEHKDVQQLLEDFNKKLFSKEAIAARQKNAELPELKALSDGQKEKLVSFFVCTRSVWERDVMKRVKGVANVELEGLLPKLPNFKRWAERISIKDSKPKDRHEVSYAPSSLTELSRIGNGQVSTYFWREFYEGTTSKIPNLRLIALILGVDAEVVEKNMYDMELIASYYFNNKQFTDVNQHRLASPSDLRLLREEKAAAAIEEAKRNVERAKQAEKDAAIRKEQQEADAARRPARAAEAERKAVVAAPAPATSVTKANNEGLSTPAFLQKTVAMTQESSSSAQGKNSDEKAATKPPMESFGSYTLINTIEVPATHVCLRATSAAEGQTKYLIVERPLTNEKVAKAELEWSLSVLGKNYDEKLVNETPTKLVEMGYYSVRILKSMKELEALYIGKTQDQAPDLLQKFLIPGEIDPKTKKTSYYYAYCNAKDSKFAVVDCPEAFQFPERWTNKATVLVRRQNDINGLYIREMEDPDFVHKERYRRRGKGVTESRAATIKITAWLTEINKSKVRPVM